VYEKVDHADKGGDRENSTDQDNDRRHGGSPQLVN
jgi:hypothetical protein